MPIDHTPTDIQYVKMYLLLPMILSAFERDKKIIERHLKTPGPYISSIDSAMDRVAVDLKEVKRKFRSLGIKVYEEARTEKGIEAKYLCRGYHHDFDMLWSRIAAECGVLMESYLGLDISKYIDPAVPGSDGIYGLPNDIESTT
ncbi:hypothetical protein [Paenibacillus aceti]|uniref:Uncharacterized protein n=1 Tax=Paenibacillus aceti TaxID=1820010 RepID=A0ABQ1VR11_9BACL|nr:hypothetical protein [Paenibacillus aceti]GGF87101.1 hypothetical protein GCM10010913_05720 [Paenibacillus aceti]